MEATAYRMCLTGSTEKPFTRNSHGKSLGSLLRSMSLTACLDPSATLEEQMELEVASDKRQCQLLDSNKLSIGPAFATGGSGILYHGMYCGKSVAVKILHNSASRLESERYTREFLQEVSALSMLNHRNVLQLVGAFWDGESKCVVTEFAAGGNVRQFLQKQQQVLPIHDVLRMALDVAQGMEYLHANFIIHRDLKSENLLMDSRGVIKIMDFGISKFARPCMAMTAETGTYRWMAPEVIEGKQYDASIDVYSFGIVLWELLTTKQPYEDLTVVQAVFAVVQKNLRPPVPEYCPPGIRKLIQACWQAEPSCRPSFSEIVMVLKRMLKVY